MILAVLFFTACCERPWQTFEMSTPPDRQCRTGTEAGDDFYIWDCIDDEHVVITAYTSPATCAAPEMETVACGEQTEMEIAHADELADCREVPQSMRWSE
ncbi:MAG: hypothetical protein Q8P41_19515 [Pseudomonadota bacterium]|nr:hypothetical protein [Pseudomonadota bacterium]